MFLDAGPAREFARIARSLTRSPKSGAGVRADVAVRVAAAAGLDAHAIYAAAAPQSPDMLEDALGWFGERVDARRSGVDLTFSAPKSVSPLFTFGDSAPSSSVSRSRPCCTSSNPAPFGRGRTSPAARSSSSTRQRWSGPGTWPDSWPTPSSTAHWKTARHRVGQPSLHFHDLRHAGLTLSAQSGATVAEVMRRAGHVSTQAAMRSQHVAEERDAEIAVLMASRARK